MSRRKPYPAQRKRKGRPFTIAIWRSWMADRLPDSSAISRRAAIEKFRRLLEVRP